MGRDLWLERMLPGVVWLAALALYVYAAAPSIVTLFDDTLEFQLVGPTFGIAHPTGYPLYVILGGVWTRLLPLGNWAWRMNLVSALFAATAVLFLFLLTRRLARRADGTPNQWAGLAAVAAFAMGQVWSAQATVAEVYALHLLFVGAILTVAVGTNQAGHIGRTTQGALDRRMTGLMLLCGLSLAHHRTTLLLAPGLALYLLWSVPDLWRPRRIWLIWIAALIMPLLLYAWIPLRAFMGVRDLNGSYVQTWSGFWDHVLARRYGAFFAPNQLAVPRDVRDWGHLFVSEVGLLAPALSVLGLVWLINGDRRPAKAWILVLVVLLTNLLFALNYRVGDVEVFLLPVFYCGAVFVGGGVALFDRLIANRIMAAIVQAVLIVLLVVGDWGAAPFTNRRAQWDAHNYAVAMAKVDFPPNSRVIGLEGEMTALKYMQQAEGLGLNATPVVANDPAERIAYIDGAMTAGTPTFLTREVSGIEERFSFTGDGPLVRVWPRGQVDMSAPAVPVDVVIADEPLRVTGYDLVKLDQPGAPTLRLTLHWLPTGAVARDYKVSLRVTDASGAPLIGRDGTPLVKDAFPLRLVARTRQWEPGTPLTDVYYVPVDYIPADVASHDSADGTRLLTIIVYDAETGAEAARHQIDLGPFWGVATSR